MAIKITNENYQKYKGIFEVFWHHCSLLLPRELNNGPTPIDVLNQFESKSKALARRSLQSAIGDTVFMAQDIPIATIQEIDLDLKSRGLPDFNTFQKEVTDTLGKVLKKGKIKNLDEYYIIQEYVIDMNNELTDGQRKLLSSYISTFESKEKPAG